MLRWTTLCAMSALLAALVAGPTAAQPAKGDPKDLAAIAKNAEAFLDAFQKADAKALAALWAAEAEYIDQSGRSIKGRDAIEKAFQTLFNENKNLKLRIDSEALRFVTADVAIEEGTTAVISPDGPPSRSRYTIVHVRKDGKWLLDSVREAAFVPPSNYAHLRGFEWAIGDWTGTTENGDTERLSFSWSESRNFVVSSFTTTARNVSVGGLTVWTGWDPTAKNVRSWLFDATGAFGEGTWTQDGKKWLFKTSVTLQDGKKATATQVFSRNNDAITMQSKDRTIDGKSIPDGKEVVFKRVK